MQSYAATFYVEQGLGAMSFTYNIIGQVLGVVGNFTPVVLFDITGRRPLLIYGGAVACLLLYLASGLGTIKDQTTDQTNMMLACFMLLPAFTRISATNNSFLTGAEIGGVRVAPVEEVFTSVQEESVAFIFRSGFEPRVFAVEHLEERDG